MNKEDLVNWWDEYTKYANNYQRTISFGDFMQWLKDNDTRTEANPYIYHEADVLAAAKRNTVQHYDPPSEQNDLHKSIRSILRLYVNRHITGDEMGRKIEEFELEAIEAIINLFPVSTPHVVGRRNACLTGREWYDRFEKELKNKPSQRFPEYSDAVAAARRAAGLDENGEVV